MNCLTCKQQLNQLGRPDTDDCGGDCVRCMAQAGDPDCILVMREIEPDGDWQQNDD